MKRATLARDPFSRFFYRRVALLHITAQCHRCVRMPVGLEDGRAEPLDVGLPLQFNGPKVTQCTSSKELPSLVFTV